MKQRKASQERFLKFVSEVWPTFIGGRHHAKMADAFERVAQGYAQRMAADVGRFARIDADQPVEAVWQQVRAVFSQRGWLA